MNQEEIDNYIKAGKIAAEVLEYGKILIKKGSSLLEVTDKIEKKIFELKGMPAFPVQISLNEAAAHYCPDSEDKTSLEDQICCLDVGVHVDGCIGDNAVTVDLSGKNSELVKASREAVNGALKIIQIGTTLGEIGKVIQETIEGFGFKPVRNLSGHGLESYNIHARPTIPNFDTKDKTALEKGQVIAIEPFATPGSGLIHEKGNATVFAQINKKPVRVGFVREILKQIESYNMLPFTKRWLTANFSEAKVNYALKQLKQLEIIREYPPLVERTNALVSQAEHSVIVDEKVIITTKLD